MKKCLLLCFWVMWSATTVSRNDQGGLTFKGGVSAGPAAEEPSFSIEKAKPGDRYWRKTGGFFDTKKDCEAATKDEWLSNQRLVCLPNGIAPKDLRMGKR